MDGTITSAGTITGELSVQQALSGELTRPSRELYPVGVQDVEVDGVSVVTDSVASIDLTGKADVSSLATVATTGDYDDLTGKPTIPSKTSDLTNDSGFITDVEIDETSIVTDGVAEIPHATNNTYGVVKATNIVTGNPSTGETYNYGQITYGNGSNLNLATTALASTSKRGLMSKDDKAKLDGIASGAEANVQSDWSQSDSTADDYIKNKPTIPSKTSDLTNDSGFITGYTETDPVFAASAAHGIASSDITAWNGKQDALVSGTNIKTINNESLLGSGNITVQGGGGVTDVEIDETSIVTDGVAEIPHAKASAYGVVKASIVVVGSANSEETYNYGKITYGNDSVLSLASNTLASTSKRGLMSKDDKTKLDAIATGAEVNVQSDWNESDSASDAYIANKPTIPTVPTNVSAFTNDAGYLTSYTETDPTVPSWAKASSKPTYTYSEVGAAEANHSHSDATTSASGFMSSADKTKLDGVPTIHISTSAPTASDGANGDIWLQYTN